MSMPFGCKESLALFSYKLQNFRSARNRRNSNERDRGQMEETTGMYCAVLS